MKHPSIVKVVPNMPRTITYEELVAAVESQTFIKNGTKESAEGIKYDFRMGSRVLKASKHGAVDIDLLPETEKNEMVVEPGEVVFVLTEEDLELPNTIMAQLVPKRKLSHEGIIVLGGFCVDPLYTGKLLVGLYNFSSTRFALKPRRKLIAAVFYELRGDEIGTLQKPEVAVTDFPDDLERFISSYQPIDLKGLREQISAISTEIKEVKDEILTDKQWKRDFQNNLDQQSDRIDKILKGLEEENKARTAGEKAISEQIGALKVTHGQAAVQQSSNSTLLITLLTIVLTAIITVACTLLGVWLTRKAEPELQPQIQRPIIAQPQSQIPETVQPESQAQSASNSSPGR